MALRSEVAAFYPGCNVADLTDDEVLGMSQHIIRLKAEKVLDEARIGKVRLSPDGWFDYVMEATGDLRAAEHAHFLAAKASLKEGGGGMG